MQDGGEKLQMVTAHFPLGYNRLEILDHLSRRFVYCENFPVGRAKIVLPFTLWTNVPEVLDKW